MLGELVEGSTRDKNIVASKSTGQLKFFVKRNVVFNLAEHYLAETFANEIQRSLLKVDEMLSEIVQTKFNHFGMLIRTLLASIHTQYDEIIDHFESDIMFSNQEQNKKKRKQKKYYFLYIYCCLFFVNFKFILQKLE